MSLTPQEIKTCACGAQILVFRRRGPRDQCRLCLSRARIAKFIERHPGRKAELARSWEQQNRDKSRRSCLEWQKRNPDKVAAKSRRWYAQNREKAIVQRRAYYLANRDREIQKVVNRLKRLRRAVPSWADLNAIAEIYAAARRRSAETGVQHQVDHIIPLHGKTVSGLHVEANLQILVAEANRIKGNSFGGS